MGRLETSEGFEWDDGNATKNWDKHRVSRAEREEVFFNVPIILGDDIRRSDAEKRFYVFGRTTAGRPLFISFTTRGGMIRVISARDMDKRERMDYEKAKKDSDF
ncbi:MAG: BrnT family toxin [Nitrospinae bacterium]|nr:BrnT family toxin [Nitrospinota bacterium]